MVPMECGNSQQKNMVSFRGKGLAKLTSYFRGSRGPFFGRKAKWAVCFQSQRRQTRNWGLSAAWCFMDFQMGMDQYLLYNTILGGWKSIYQLFWCSPGVQGFDTLPDVAGISGWKMVVGWWFASWFSLKIIVVFEQMLLGGAADGSLGIFSAGGQKWPVISWLWSELCCRDHLRLALATKQHSAPQVHEAYDGLHNRYETLPSPGLFLNRPWMAMLSALKIMYHLEVSIVMVPQARWMVLTGHSIYGWGLGVPQWLRKPPFDA